MLVFGLVLLLQLFYIADNVIDAISIEDMIFKTPEYVGDHPPSIPLVFKGGVPTADFSIGTPPQNFTGIFDTGSPITWVISNHCNNAGCENVPISEKFNQTASTTNTKFPTEIDLSYLDGTHVRLIPELDTVTLAEQFQFPRHLIGEATMVDYPVGFVPAANARIGVGDYSDKILDPNPAKVAESFNPPVGGGLQRRAAGDAHTSTGPVASGSPNFRKRGPKPSNDFLWILGDDPTMYTGPLYKLNLIDALDNVASPFWKVPLKGLKVGKQEFQLSGGSYGTVSSSTPYIMVPPSIAGVINKAIGAHYNANTRTYTIACSARFKESPIVIEFSQGVNAAISAAQYINEYEHIPAGRSDHCFSTIVNGPDDHTLYLGGPFFRSYYLGFAVMEQAIYIAESVVNTGAKLSATSAYKDQDNSAGPAPVQSPAQQLPSNGATPNPSPVQPGSNIPNQQSPKTAIPGSTTEDTKNSKASNALDGSGAGASSNDSPVTAGGIEESKPLEGNQALVPPQNHLLAQGKSAIDGLLTGTPDAQMNSAKYTNSLLR